MKILVYGFEPYSSMRKNISEEVIMKIRRQRNLAKVVFPVKFEKKLFLEKIRKLKPDLILGPASEGQQDKN
jgi:pyrrolidone-carboxylate peptidase